MGHQSSRCSHALTANIRSPMVAHGRVTRHFLQPPVSHGAFGRRFSYVRVMKTRYLLKSLLLLSALKAARSYQTDLFVVFCRVFAPYYADGEHSHDDVAEIGRAHV